MNQMTRIVAAPAHGFKARFTSTEFVGIARAGEAAGIKLELIDGELERMSPPMGGHIKRQTSMIAALLDAVRDSDVVAAVEVGLRLDDETVVTCDAAVLRIDEFPERYLTPQEAILVVEVADATINRDQGPKRIKYAAAAIPEYWIVDIARNVVRRYREPVDGDYVQVDSIRFGEPLAVPGTDATITLS